MRHDPETVALRRIGLICMLLAGMPSSPAGAGELPDPTRPPTALRQQAAMPAQAAQVATPVLQSVLTGAGRKPSVIINGRTLELGDSVDGMRLTSVTETGAVLVGPRGTTALALTSASVKLAVAPPAASPTRPSIVTATAPAAEPGDVPSTTTSLQFRPLETK